MGDSAGRRREGPRVVGCEPKVCPRVWEGRDGAGGPVDGGGGAGWDPHQTQQKIMKPNTTCGVIREGLIQIPTSPPHPT